MVEVIGDLVDDLVLARVLGRDDDLGILFAQLFEHFIHALVKEVVGIGTFFGIVPAVDDRLIVLAQDIAGSCRAAGAHPGFCHPVEETGVAACVAGGADLDDTGKQCIHVAVAAEGADILEMSAGLTLDPERLTAPGEIGHPAGFDSHVKSLFVHIGDHEDLIRGVLLDNDRQQAVRTFFEISPGKSCLFVLLHLDPAGCEAGSCSLDGILAAVHKTVDAIAGDRRHIGRSQFCRQMLLCGI